MTDTGGSGNPPDGDGGNNEPNGGIIAAYVIFAIGAVLIVIGCIWLGIHLSKKRRKKREQQSSAPTILYTDDVGLSTIVPAKKVSHAVSNNNEIHVSGTLVRNAHENGGFSTITRPVATSTLPKAAYLVEDQVDSPRSAPPKMLFAVEDDGTLQRAEVKRAYLLTERPTSATTKALSLDRGYSRQQQQQRIRTKSRSSDTKVILAPVSRRPAQPIRVVHRSDPHVKLNTSQQSITQSMPTLLRIQPTNIGRSRTHHHNQHHHHRSQQQMYYVMQGDGATSNGSHIDDWMERHHAPAATRRNVMYEDVVNGKGNFEDVVDSKNHNGGRAHNQRSHSLPEDPDSAVFLRWSPSMKRKLELKKEKEAIRAGKSIPRITTTEPDGHTRSIELRGSVDDGLY